MPNYWAKTDLGLDAILCCPGPSLVNTEFLRGIGRMVFAINTAYPTVKPDIWLGMDEIYCYDANILNEPFRKIFRGNYCEMVYNDKKIKHYPETYFADIDFVPAGKTMLDLRANNVRFAWHAHTLGVALHLIIWMGAKNIYLYGCDMGGETDYCHDLKLTADQRLRNQNLYAQQTVFLEKLFKAADKHGINIWSCTVNSPINKFLPFKHISAVVNKSTIPNKIRYVTDKPIE